MALTPHDTYKMNGVIVNEKIIPDNTRWKDGVKALKAGFAAGALYKRQKKLSNGTGKAQSVTVHNTDDLENVYQDSEQYTRATYNENMGSSRVHFYVDDVDAWQNLRAGTGLCPADPVGSAEMGWHSGDASISDGGNATSLSIEIIMGDIPARDEKAKDNGARVAAWLLWKNGLSIDKLLTHTYWVNKSAGNKFADVDKQCTNLVKGKKWCPTYIFGSTNETVALKNWKAFKAQVKAYLDALNKGTATKDCLYRVQVGAFSEKKNADAQAAKVKAAGFSVCVIQENGLYKIQAIAAKNKANAESMLSKLKKAGFDATIVTSGGQVVASAPEIKVGSNVKVKNGAKTYDGKPLSPYVYKRTHKVKQIDGKRVVITFNGVVVAAVNKADLTLV